MSLPNVQPAPTTPAEPVIPPSGTTLPASQATHIGTATVFIFNNGRAAAKEVLIGHFAFPPAHGVWPDIPREIINLPGGGTAIRFPLIPRKMLVSISYLMASHITPTSIDQIISYVSSEDGYAKRIPVMLQRIFPPSVITTLRILWLAGLWVLVNALITLVVFLWRLYH